jgi:hypothetical protein
MPNFGSAKREREYEELKDKFQESGRYGKRAKQVAARIVNKQRSQYGETKEERKKDRDNRSPDRDLPISDYQHLTVPQVKRKLDDCSKQELRQIKKYEQGHKARKTLLAEIDQRMK